MSRKTYRPDEKLAFEQRFGDLLENIFTLTHLDQREQYLYPLMDSQAFKDFEAALGLAVRVYPPIANDNKPQWKVYDGDQNR